MPTGASSTPAAVSNPAPRSLYGDALSVDETALDAAHGADHLAAELRAVKARVQRRRGMVVLPVVVLAVIGSAAYATLLDPVVGNSVEVVSEDPTDAARAGGDADEPTDAAPAEDADAATDLAAATAGRASPALAADASGDAGPLGDAPADAGVNRADRADRSGTAGDEATEFSPNDQTDSSAGVAAPGLDQPNPPAVPIEFDTSNVITRQSPESAPLPTPPVAAADESGVTAGATARVDSGLANTSDAEVGAAPLTDSPSNTGDDADASTSAASGDALEGPLDASPESLPNTDNPSIGGQGSGEGAASAGISFEDDGSAPQISATSSAAVATPVTVLSTPHFAVANQQVTLTLTATGAQGQPVGPCGVTVDWGDGQIDALPCAVECTMQPHLHGEVSVTMVRDFATAGLAQITIDDDGSGCLSADALVLQLTLLAG